MSKVLVAALVLVLMVSGLYWFSQKTGEEAVFVANKPPNKSLIETATTALPSAVVEDKEISNSLYDLKSSIQGVIDDSVEEEIQQAVESEINKSEEAQNK